MNEKLGNLIKAAAIAKDLGKINPNDFVLKNPLKLDAETLKLVVNQSIFNETIAKKIPSWANIEGLLAPPKISLEQSSSEATATYKSQKVSGKNGMDLTGGLGVDAYFFAKNFEKFTHNEINLELSEIVKNNFEKLGSKNISLTNSNAESLSFEEKLDFIYADPARRDHANRKMVSIQDCSPNILDIKDLILENTETFMIKYSPMLDIKESLSLLKLVDEVIILAEKNEVKELVFILKKTENADPVISCVNLGGNGKEFQFRFSDEKATMSQFSEPKKYLFEANAAIMKAGGFKSVGNIFGLEKLSPSSHLYTSGEIKGDFPGRIFEIEEQRNYDKKELKTIKKANVAVRNFPKTPDQIKKELGWKDGGDKYVFFTENLKKKKLVLICNKIQ
ncbi:class I SAM-dependent methyltransferase [Lacihabitans sp. LS3-19]|uniref:THUMP-like domain-containing protein n=1 Tax=Lacihabitans sp. LS3-19 TaxID=2487335 RepID=UPI0020CFC07D|nr:hypothetical protein [Lacihabitans sp. LS3-19]MCP9770252.1 class I SAM-dependent methyltransferase [Lacihabitans sp. LS3-19]